MDHTCTGNGCDRGRWDGMEGVANVGTLAMATAKKM